MSADGPKRGRPREEKKDEAIYDATWAILAEKGYEGLTFEGVAELVGCSRSTLYRRFSNKVDLVKAVLNTTARPGIPQMEDTTPPREVLIHLAEAACTDLAAPRGPATLMLAISVKPHEELTSALAEHTGKEKFFFMREFCRAYPDTPADVRDFAFNTLIGAIIFQTAILRATLSREQVATLVDQAIALLDRQSRDPR